MLGSMCGGNFTSGFGRGFGGDVGWFDAELRFPLGSSMVPVV